MGLHKSARRVLSASTFSAIKGPRNLTRPLEKTHPDGAVVLELKMQHKDEQENVEKSSLNRGRGAARLSTLRALRMAADNGDDRAARLHDLVEAREMEYVRAKEEMGWVRPDDPEKPSPVVNAVLKKLGPVGSMKRMFTEAWEAANEAQRREIIEFMGLQISSRWGMRVIVPARRRDAEDEGQRGK
jgi:hypothetical protein